MGSIDTSQYSKTVERAREHLRVASQLFVAYKQSVLENIGDELTDSVEVDDNIKAEYDYNFNMADEVSDELGVLRDFIRETKDHELIFEMYKDITGHSDLPADVELARRNILEKINSEIADVCSGIEKLAEGESVLLNDNTIQPHDETLDQSYA